LYANYSLDTALDTWVDSPKIDVAREQITCNKPHRIWELAPFTALDVAATVNEGRDEVALAVINRSLEDEIVTDVRLAEGGFGGGKIYQMLADPHARNDFATPNAVSVMERTLDEAGRLPAVHLPGAFADFPAYASR